jgi:hypothetical protein
VVATVTATVNAMMLESEKLEKSINNVPDRKTKFKTSCTHVEVSIELDDRARCLRSLMRRKHFEDYEMNGALRGAARKYASPFSFWHVSTINEVEQL